MTTQLSDPALNLANFRALPDDAKQPFLESLSPEERKALLLELLTNGIAQAFTADGERVDPSVLFNRPDPPVDPTATPDADGLFSARIAWDAVAQDTPLSFVQAAGILAIICGDSDDDLTDTLIRVEGVVLGLALAQQRPAWIEPALEALTVAHEADGDCGNPACRLGKTQPRLAAALKRLPEISGLPYGG